MCYGVGDMTNDFLNEMKFPDFNVELVSTNLSLYISEGLLCEKSEYFNRLFKNSMKECSEKKIIFDEKTNAFNTPENVVITVNCYNIK